MQVRSILHIISFEKYQHLSDQLPHYFKICLTVKEICLLNVAKGLEENKERAQWSKLMMFYDIHYLLSSSTNRFIVLHKVLQAYKNISLEMSSDETFIY